MKNTIRRCAFAAMLVLLVAGLFAVAAPALAEAAAPKPTSVKLDQKGTVKLPVGSTLTLNATLSPATAQTTLTWRSSKKKVATVSNGVVTAKKVGTTTITVKTKNKKKAKVKVKVIDPYKPSSVSLGPYKQSMFVMSGLQLNAVLYPETAQSTLKWKSSNKKVATVSKTGLVTATAAGKTTITVTTRNKKKAKIKLQVIDDGQQPITTAPGYNLPYVIYACKKSHTIAIVARDETGAWTRVIRTFPTGIGRNPKNTDAGIFFISKKERWHRWGSGYSPYANKLSVGLYLHGPIYKSKNHNTIRPSYYNCIGKNCSSGCLRTVCGCAAWVYYNCPVGTQVIVAENSRFSAPRPTKIGKKAKRDPTDPGNNPEILMTGFTVEPGAMTLNQGASAGIAPGNFSPAKTTTTGFIYESTNPGVATVSPEGVVTGVGAGSAVIRVIANDDYRCTAQIPVNVNAVAGAGKLEEAAPIELPDEVIVAEELPAAEVEETIVEIPAEEAASEAAEEPAEEPAGEAAEESVEAPAGETDDGTAGAEAPEGEPDPEDTGSPEAEEPADPDGEAAGTAEDDSFTVEAEEVAEEEAEVLFEEE